MEEEERRCKNIWCNKILVRQEGETPSNWKKKKYCNKTCGLSSPKRKTKKNRSFNPFIPYQKDIFPWRDE